MKFFLKKQHGPEIQKLRKETDLLSKQDSPTYNIQETYF